MSGPVITAGIDVQADGLQLRLTVSLPHPEVSTPSSEGSTVADATGQTERSVCLAALTAATASAPGLLAAFEQARSIVLESQATLLEQQLTELRDQSTRGSLGGMTVEIARHGPRADGAERQDGPR